MSLIDRVKNIILTPKTEWPVIDREPGDVAYIFTNYVAILAAIPAICGFIGMSIVGISSPGAASMRVSVATGLLITIMLYLATFAVVYVVALVVDALAPTFAGHKNFESALKVTAYSYTPLWIVGILLLIPLLGLVTFMLTLLAGLYSIYLLYTGLPVLMKSPQDKILPYTAAAAVSALIIYVIFTWVIGALFAYPRMV